MTIKFSCKIFSSPTSLRPRASLYCHDKHLDCLIQKSCHTIVVPMCLTRLNRPLQTSHKDGKGHFENNMSHKDHIQLLLTCLDNLFHVTVHQFLNHLTNYPLFHNQCLRWIEEAEEFLCSHHLELPAHPQFRLGPIGARSVIWASPVGKPSRNQGRCWFCWIGRREHH